MNQHVVKQFFDAWSIYDQVLERNYMFHAELFAQIRQIIADRFAGRAFSVLDLGCGSARHMAQALHGASIRRYVGLDLSDAALAQAGKNLAPLGCQAELRQADLLQGLQNEAETFDLVFSSYASHHLSTNDKQNLFQHIFDRLHDDGIFLLVDMAREEEQDTATCLDHYCNWIDSEWTALPAGAKEMIFEHIRKNDFPETSAVLNSMAVRAGFGGSQDVCQFLWHHLWEFTKQPTA
jgi:SAM-dependent methyltransferase